MAVAGSNSIASIADFTAVRSVVGAAAICAVPENVTRATLKLAGTMSTNSLAAV